MLTTKSSRILAVAAAVFGAAAAVLAFAGSASAASAEIPTIRAPSGGPYQTLVAANKLATPGGGPRRQCNGKTTSQCCEGLSFCGCLYMPGSSDNHPTSCHSSPPPKPKG